MITFSQDQLLDAFGKVPEPVRAYLLSKEFNADIQTIGQQFKLHVDTTGVLSQSTSYMLCGLVTPTEILGELVSRDVDAQTAKAIIAELNTKIFKPLQDKVKNAPPAGSSESEEGAAAPTPALPPVPSTPRLVMPPPAVTMAAAPALSRPTPPPAPRSIQPPVAPPAPTPSAQPAAPAPAPRPMPPAPRPAPVPVNLPGTMDAPEPPAPSPVSNKEALHEVLKSYGVDPYREEPE